MWVLRVPLSTGEARLLNEADGVNCPSGQGPGADNAAWRSKVTQSNLPEIKHRRQGSGPSGIRMTGDVSVFT